MVVKAFRAGARSLVVILPLGERGFGKNEKFFAGGLAFRGRFC
jgi:hypothetical protein